MREFKVTYETKDGQRGTVRVQAMDEERAREYFEKLPAALTARAKAVRVQAA